MLVDSHCHLNFADFNDDLDDVIANAHNAGIGKMVSICTHLGEFEQVHDIANKYPNVYCSVGVHPHDVEKQGEYSLQQLLDLAAKSKVVGLGETGLDYFYEHSPRDLQKQSFVKHIDASRQTGLPVIIHTRDADKDTIDIINNEQAKGKFTGLIHCFSSTDEVAQAALDNGMYISISGIITFKKAQDLRDVVSKLPLERLLVETDSPFLAPVPHRGKRNEPAYTKLTAQYLAELLNISYDELEAKTTANFNKLFNRAA